MKKLCSGVSVVAVVSGDVGAGVGIGVYVFVAVDDVDDDNDDDDDFCSHPCFFPFLGIGQPVFSGKIAGS